MGWMFWRDGLDVGEMMLLWNPASLHHGTSQSQVNNMFLSALCWCLLCCWEEGTQNLQEVRSLREAV